MAAPLGLVITVFLICFFPLSSHIEQHSSLVFPASCLGLAPNLPNAGTCISSPVFFIIYKGASGLELDETSIGIAFAWAFGLGIACGIITIPTMIPYMRKKVDEKFNEDGTPKVTVS